MNTRLRAAMDRDERGFTLIELLVVIIIIGILAAIAIPVFLNQRKKGYDAQTKSDLRNSATAEESYLGDNTAAYLTCVGTAACTASSALGAYGFKASPSDKISISADAGKGYCAVGLSQSGKYFIYDSEAGGIQAYNGTVAPTTATDGITAGACENLVSPVTYPAPAA